MKHKIVRLFVDYEKEEAWLNQMAAKGLHFMSYVFPVYLFEDGEPGAYIYRLELLDELPSHPASRKYLRFLADSGVECVDTYLRWVYFRKPASDGPFELYTDAASRIRHYHRIMLLLGVLICSQLAISASNANLFQRTGNPTLLLINLLFLVLMVPVFIRYAQRVRKLKRLARVQEV